MLLRQRFWHGCLCWHNNVRQVYKNHAGVEVLAFFAMNALVEALHAGWSGKVKGASSCWWKMLCRNGKMLADLSERKTIGCCIFMIGLISTNAWSVALQWRESINFSPKKTTLVQNAKVFEASAMEEVTAGELYMLEQVDTLDNGIQILQPKTLKHKQTVGLVSRLFPGVPLQAISTSTMARCQDGNVLAGDVALFAGEEGHTQWACGRIHLHAQCFGQAPMVVVSKFKLLEMHSHYACWKLMDNAPMMLVPLQNVFTSVTYAEGAQQITRWRFKKKQAFLKLYRNSLCRLCAPSFLQPLKALAAFERFL